MFSIVVNLDGVTHKMETLSNSAADLEKPLGIFGGYMRKKALAKYEAQSFAPLAESTMEKRARKGIHQLERKLHGDYRKAVRKSAGGKGVVEEILGQASRRSRNRLAVLAEYQRRHGFKLHGAAAGMELKPLSVKQLASLDERTGRAVERSVGKPILGGLTRTLVVEVGGGSMTLKSKTHEKWSDIHNTGGTAGHGAKIPKRETIAVGSSDLEVLCSILKQYLLLPFEEGMHGPGF